ncbi:hypothetical protein OIV83_002891 [Microbotryomycetes sp. JL201]|nr:hypothetical protein OIV83_002891 [Microbotryomycetes sp. JL201]
MPLAAWGQKTNGSEVVKHLAAHIKGKTVLITGASPGGLGAEMAKNIAPADPALIILAGRSQQKLDDCVTDVKHANSAANVKTLILDLSSFKTVRESAREFQSWNVNLDVLVNNAGIMALPERRLSADGYELQLATNHLGHFLFTGLVKDRLKAGARIVNVSSLGHRNSPFRFDDPNFEQEGSYVPFTAYGQAKTANMLFSKGISLKWPFTSISLHPGAIWTNLVSNNMTDEQLESMGWKDRNSEKMKSIPWKNLDQGTATHIVAAFDPDMQNHNGSYLDDCQVADEANKAYALDTASLLEFGTVSPC